MHPHLSLYTQQLHRHFTHSSVGGRIRRITGGQGQIVGAGLGADKRRVCGHGLTKGSKVQANLHLLPLQTMEMRVARCIPLPADRPGMGDLMAQLGQTKP